MPWRLLFVVWEVCSGMVSVEGWVRERMYEMQVVV